MAKFTNTPLLGDRFTQALTFAHQAHILQVRKGEIEVPYISHLLAVCSLVLESGGSEDEAVAALLHDSIEDVEVHPRLIREMFGDNVWLIVKELSEDKALIKSERKKIYAQSVLEMSESAVRVSIADKLHNLRCYRSNPELFGEEQHDFYAALIPNYERREISGAQIAEMRLLFEKLS